MRYLKGDMVAMTNDVMPYSEYFSVDKGYYPEINPNSVKDPNNDWKKTYPHPTFIKLLRYLDKMLAWDITGKKHWLWVQGSYGTGKSRLVWTVQQMMSCSDDELRSYFGEYDALRKETTLLDNMLAHKHEKIVTVFRYSTGDMNMDDFITAIYDSVSEALKKEGYDCLGSRTIRGRIAEWLLDESHQQIFSILVNKPAYRSLGSFSGKTVDDIISHLNSSGDSDQLLRDLINMSEREHVGMFTLSMEDLKSWLTDVIDVNELSSILFIWDEFSSFMKKNKDALDRFQSLAELSSEKPFKMVIVTHMAGSLASDGDEQFSTIRDRFEETKIEMPENIAFELIGHAMKINPASSEIWDELKGDLASRTPDSRKAVANAVNVEDSVMQKMIPIHPMTALALKFLSESFASNTRSMFNFIKNNQNDDVNDENAVKAFQWFIKTHSPDEGDLLTIDYLWDFFYEKGTDEHSSGTGRSNLDMIIAGILDTYPSCQSRLNSEQKRVLKVVLLMQAISRKRNNGIPLLIPTEKNIKLAFEGCEDTFSTNVINIVKNQLVSQLKILFASPMDNGIDAYVTAAIEGDQAKIDEIIERLKNETTTTKLIKDGKLETAFEWPAALRMRFEFSYVTVDDFTKTINKLADEPAGWKMKAVVCIARNEKEQSKLRELISVAREDESKREVVIIDATPNLMGTDRFDEWAKFAGNEEYWRPKDDELANIKHDGVDTQLEAWSDDIREGDFFIYYRETGKKPCSMQQLKNEALPVVVLERYPLSFDNVQVSSNFFDSSNLPFGAKCGITETAGGVFQNSSISAILKDVWCVSEYWNKNSNTTLPITKLKKELDQYILGRFESGEIRISQVEIFRFLMERGFMPCNLYAFLTGFLLKEYNSEKYRYGIGNGGDGGDRMNAEILSAHIGEAIKQCAPNPPRNYKEKYIEIMTPEQKAFIDFAVKAFNIPDNYSVELAASKMRTSLKNLGYPIWCYKVIDSHNLEKMLDRIADIANDRTGDNVPALAGKLGRLLLDITNATDNLIELLSKENGEEAMKEFLLDFRGGRLLDLSKEINTPNVLEDVRHCLASGEALWLWNQEDGETELDKLILEYEIVAASNAYAGNNTFEKSTTFTGSLNAWRNCLRYTHIPYTMIRDHVPELKDWLSIMKEIHSDGTLISEDKHQKLFIILKQQYDAISEFLANRLSVFANCCENCIADLSSDEISSLYNKLPNTTFSDTATDFIKNVQTSANKILAEQKKYKLFSLWKKLSGYDGTPKEWSEEFKTPILALVSPSDSDRARKTFDTLNSSTPTNADIDSASEYLQAEPSFLGLMMNKESIDRAFTKQLIGQYHCFITLQEARDELSSLATEAYYWMTGTQAMETIRKKAMSNYLSGGNTDLLKKIDDMDPPKAKKYLVQLVQNYVDVGIRIMNDEE